MPENTEKSLATADKLRRKCNGGGTFTHPIEQNASQLHFVANTDSPQRSKLSYFAYFLEKKLHCKTKCFLNFGQSYKTKEKTG